MHNPFHTTHMHTLKQFHSCPGCHSSYRSQVFHSICGMTHGRTMSRCYLKEQRVYSIQYGLLCRTFSTN